MEFSVFIFSYLESKETDEERQREERQTWVGRFGGNGFARNGMGLCTKLTWKTVTVAHKKLLKCLRSHSQSGCFAIISEQVHSLSPNSSSINLQNLPPKRYMPRMLQFIYNMNSNGIFDHVNSLFHIK